MNEKRRVIVVGGASGIGAATVEHLAASGWEVLVADLREPQPACLASGAAVVDVRDAEAMKSVVNGLLQGRTLHGLVYAAGTGHISPLSEIPPERWRLVLDVNLTGAFNAARAVVEHMSERGSLVFISSVDGERPVPGLAHYCASKAGLDALSRSIALEWGSRQIRSNVVAPGPVLTPLMRDFLADPALNAEFVALTPLGTIAIPSQIATVIGFLLSDDSSHITGARIPVDGGMSLREHPSMLTP